MWHGSRAAALPPLVPHCGGCLATAAMQPPWPLVRSTREQHARALPPTGWPLSAGAGAAACARSAHGGRAGRADARHFEPRWLAAARPGARHGRGQGRARLPVRALAEQPRRAVLVLDQPQVHTEAAHRALGHAPALELPERAGQLGGRDRAAVVHAQRAARVLALDLLAVVLLALGPGRRPLRRALVSDPSAGPCAMRKLAGVRLAARARDSKQARWVRS